jgi:hypothetical protein
MAAEDWKSQEDAIDIGRRLRPKLSYEELWQMLEDAAGPPPKIVSIEGSDQLIREKPSDEWPVRTRWPTIYVREYFGPDVERLFGKPTKPASASKRAPAPKASRSTTRISKDEWPKVVTLYKEAHAHKTPSGPLTDPEVQALGRQHYGDKITVDQMRKAAKEAGATTSRRGRHITKS